MRRSVIERRFPGKYADFKFTCSVLSQKFETPQYRRWDELGPERERASQHGSLDSNAFPSHSKEVAVGMQHTAGHRDRECPIQGKLDFNDHHLSPEYIPQVSMDNRYRGSLRRRLIFVLKRSRFGRRYEAAVVRQILDEGLRSSQAYSWLACHQGRRRPGAVHRGISREIQYG